VNDPHVTALHYRIVAGESVDYDNAPPVDAEFGDFRLSVDSGDVVAEMKTHFAAVDEARTLVDGFLRRWELVSGLEQDPGNIRFEFGHADIVDRSPDPEDKDVVHLRVAGPVSIRASVRASMHVSRGKYPSLPGRFADSPDVQVMYARYEAYCQKREKLTSMAYMCLTVLEASASDGGDKRRRNAARKYSIDYEVLSTLGKLSSTKGDIAEARKSPDKGEFAPLTSQETEWIVQAVKMLVRRAGQYAHDPMAELTPIGMGDLPDLGETC